MSDSSSNDDDDRSRFASAVDPSFIGRKSDVVVKQKALSSTTIIDKYCDQKKHLAKKLTKYLDSVIEYSQVEECESRVTFPKDLGKYSKPPSEICLLRTSSQPLSGTSSTKEDLAEKIKSHNRKAKLLKMKIEASSSSSSSSDSGDDADEAKSKKKKKKEKRLSDDVLACVVTIPTS